MGLWIKFWESIARKNEAQVQYYNAQMNFYRDYTGWGYMIFEALNDARLKNVVCPPLDVTNVCCVEESTIGNFAFRINFVKECDDGVRRYVKQAIAPVLLRGLGISAADLKEHYRIKIVQDKILISYK